MYWDGSDYKIKAYRCWLLLIFAFPVFGYAQKIDGPIALHQPVNSLNSTEYYIANVTDDREDVGSVATLVYNADHTGNITRYPLDLKGGAISAIKQFITTALPANKTMRAVTVHIRKFNLNEELQAGGLVSGKLAVSLSFSIIKNDEEVHLVDYRGGSNYSRSLGQQMDVSALLSSSLGNGFTWFNNWMNQQAGINIKLSKGVKLVFSDYTEQPEGDTIYYSATRPIKWADFQQKPPASRYEAEVFPSIGYTEKTEIVKSIVIVQLSMKAYLPKSACWVKDGARNAYSLNHEQRHFDIVKVVTQHFKQLLLKEKLTADNYDGYINVQYLESFREMNRLQKEYDDETNHGTNVIAQQEWNERIDKELSGSGI